MSYNINCDMIVTNYLMNRNPIYKFRGPISILITLLVVGHSDKLKLSKNVYINQLVLPICVFFISMVLIDILTRILISKNSIDKLRMKCKQWLNDPTNKKMITNILGETEMLVNMNDVYNYDGKISSFAQVNNGKEQVKERFEIVDHNMPNVNEGTDIENQDNNKTVNLDDSRAYQYLRSIHSNKQIYSATPTGMGIDKLSLKPRLEEAFTDKCMLNNGCGYLCSGTGENKCNVVAPIPGPQWQPQTAATVQNRLNNGDYVPSKCNQGGKILRRADNCTNLKEGMNCNTEHVKCSTVPTLNQ